MSNPLFRNLPSVNELLESPPLRSLVSRVNRNVVVTGVARFLDTMREDLRRDVRHSGAGRPRGTHCFVDRIGGDHGAATGD